MTTSEAINELATALAKAQAEMAGAVKDTENPFFRHKYADLASVWDACRAPLTKHGLSVLQFPHTAFSGTPETYEYKSKSGETRIGVKVACIVSVVTRLLHTSGQFVEDEASAMLATGDPQAVGSAITYLRRYSLQAVVGVSPEDDDGEAANGRTKNGNGVAKAAIPPAPEGYAAWLAVFDGVAKDGSEALRKAWVQSKEEYRDYLTRYGGGTEPLKARAVQADKIRGAVAEHTAKKAAQVPA